MFRQVLIFISAFGFSTSALAQDNVSTPPKNTINCKQFKKTGPKEWKEVGTAVFNLGEITDINLTDQPVTPGYFKFGGVDLFNVLEGKCGAVTYLDKGKRDQAKGDYDGALANLNQAILLDSKSAEALDNRGSAYYAKGEYSRALADFDEALKLDPKLESAVSHKAAAQEKLAQGAATYTLAATQIKEEDARAPAKAEEPKPQQEELQSAQLPEQTPLAKDNIAREAVLQRQAELKTANLMEQKPQEKEKLAREGVVQRQEANITEQTPQAYRKPKSENKIANAKNQSKDGSCRTKKLVYAAEGVGNSAEEGSEIEIVFEGKRDKESLSSNHSEFVIRKQRNNKVQWTYRGTYIQTLSNGYFQFSPESGNRDNPIVLTLRYIKPNRDGSGEAILYLGGLDMIFFDESKIPSSEFEGTRPSDILPEVFYFNRCE